MKNLLSLLGLLASACSPCYQLPLSADDRAWTAAYPQVGLVRTFRGSRGHQAAYRVAERLATYGNQNCDWLGLGFAQPGHFHLTLRPAAAPPTARQPDDLLLYVRKWDARQPARLDFRMAGMAAYFHEADDHHHFRLQPRPCTLADGRRFAQAYYFEAGQNATTIPRAWRSFYWDQQAGLLRFEAADGEVFDLAAD